MEEIYNFLMENGVSEDICQKVKDTYDKKFSEINTDMMVENAIIRSGAKNVKAVKALINMENITCENGEIKGIDEEIKKIKKECPYLFGSESSYQPKKGNIPADVSKMSDREYFDYIKTTK